MSVGLLGNAADVFPEMVARGIRPDAVTDQTSAHDPLKGYLPRGGTLAQWTAAREADPAAVIAAASALAMMSNASSRLSARTSR
ncbi:MAG: hypothetical protein ACRCUI_04055 [Polymorphobacter sp.]